MAKEDSNIRLNYLLAPLSFLYGLGVRLRNLLFNWKVLPAEQYPVPVICVGNLVVGGTGKTPHTEHLIRLLHHRYRVAVLSRGYKRKTSGFILATPESTCKQIGDESYQIKCKFPSIQVAVDENRRRGIRRLLALPEEERPEVILLDDAFQHRYVTPSFSIILTDYHRLFYYDRLLPVGRLREPINGIRRADAIIVTKCEKELKPIEYRIIEENMHLLAHQDVFFSRIIYSDLKAVFPDIAPVRVKRDIRKEDDVLVISGIASPAPLLQEVHKYSAKVNPITFPDHHAFTQKNIEHIDREFQKMESPEKLIIVTEKDAARLKDNPHIPEGWKKKLYSLPISIEFFGKNNTLFDKMILQHIAEVHRKQKQPKFYE